MLLVDWVEVCLPVKQGCLGTSNETAGCSWSWRLKEEVEEEVEDERKKNLKKKKTNCGWGVSAA